MKTYTAFINLHRGRGKYYPGTENIRLENVTIEQIKARLNKEGFEHLNEPRRIMGTSQLSLTGSSDTMYSLPAKWHKVSRFSWAGEPQPMLCDATLYPTKVELSDIML